MKSFLSKQSSKSFLYPYFRSIIPKDLVSNLGGATDFRLSLNYVRQEDEFKSALLSEDDYRVIEKTKFTSADQHDWGGKN